jgi:hypothetical protein
MADLGEVQGRRPPEVAVASKDQYSHEMSTSAERFNRSINDAFQAGSAQNLTAS